MEKQSTLAIDLNKISSKEIRDYIKTNLTLSNTRDSDSIKEAVFYTVGIGDWEECFNTMKSFTLQSEPYFKACGDEAGESTQEGHCADNGVNLPSVLHLNETEFYGFSEFWYTMEDILGLGGVYQETEFKDAAQVENIILFFVAYIIQFKSDLNNHHNIFISPYCLEILQNEVGSNI